MARKTDIRLRRSATTGAIPTTSNLNLGEIALNTFDGKLYTKTTESSFDQVVQVGSSTDSYHKIRKSQNISLTVKVITKTSDHAHHGSGSSSAYEINGVESPHFHLVPGNTYRFDQSDSSNSGHPLRFYYEADKTTAYTTGVTTNGTPGSSGAYTQIIPADSTPVTLHYQCSAHGYMGNRVDFGTRNLTGFDTDDLTEGSSNLYFTNARARSAISASGDLSYNSSTGVISFTQRTDAQVRGLVSVTDAGGDGSLAYNNSTGVITYTGPSAAETRAHFSGGTGVTISSGSIAIGQAVATSSNVTFADLTVTGNLSVTGTTTSLETTTLQVEDKNIVLNYGSGDTSASANGAGITIQDAESSSVDATILWDSTNDQFDFSHPITITNNSTSSDALLLESTEASSSAAPILAFKRHSGSPADADYLGQLKFKGENDADQDVVYAKITAKIQDASDGSEDGIIEFANRKAGSNVITARLRSDSFQLLNSTTLVANGLTYPTSDGSSGQALVTDGSGNLSFSSISAGGNAFGTIAVSGQSNVAADSNSDTLTLVAGSNITLTTDASGDSVTIASSGGGTTQNLFETIAVSGQSDIVADGATDTLTFAAGSNITLTTTPGTDTLTIAASGGEVTVQEEGSSLSTAATTLNFVGSGVTATGSGATKTITIPGGSSSAASDTLKRFVYTTSSSTTAFSGSDDNSETLSYTVGAVQVYLNGVLQKLTTDYAETNASTITFVNAVPSGNVVEIVAFYRTIGTGNSVVNQFTGDGSTTAFTVTTAPVSENNLLVYIDGVYQQKTDYAVSGTTLTMDTAPASGAIIETVCSVGAITEQADLTLTGDLTIGDGHLIGDDNSDNLVINSSNSESIVVASNQNIFFNTGATSLTSQGTTRMVANSSGNVGIGTSSPQGRLHIEGAAGASGGGILYITDADNGSTASDALHISKSGDTAFVYNRESSGNLQLGAGNDATHLVILSGGNVGIGTTTPAVSLDVGSLTDAIRVPNGTTAQRPTAALGQLRYNTTTSEFEGYAAGAWGKIGGGGDSFGTIAVSGQSNVVAEQENDTLTFEAGAGIVITTDASSDKVTISGGSGSVFTTDLFTASGSGSALLEYTLSTTPSSENELIVFIEGVYQNKNSYALSGTTLTFDSGIVSGQEIVVHHVGAGIVGVSPTIDTFTGNGSTAAYTLSVAPPNENYLAVFWDGVYQHHSEYSVSGTTLTFTTNVPSSTAVEVYIPSVNGIGTPSDATVTPAKLSTGGPSWDTNSNQIVGSHYVRSDSTSMSTTSATTVATHAIASFRSVNYKVQITQGTNYHTSEVNVIHDGSTADITEYGTLFTGSSLGSLTAAISSGNLLLQFTPGSNASCTVKVMSTATTV